MSKGFIKIIFVIVLAVFLGNNNTIAQSMDDSKSNKNDFVEQSTRELEKAKKLNVKTRLRYAGFFDSAGKVPQKKSLVEKLTFDKNGNRKELSRYIGDEMLDLRYIFVYDKKGRLLKMETRNASNVIVGKKESKYDKKGNEVERKLYDKKRGNMRVVFKYDQENNLIQSETFDKNKKSIGRYVNTYENGAAKTTTVYDKGGNVTREIWFIYNEEGKLIREDYKDLSNSYSIKNRYDEKGNIIEVETPQTKRMVTYDNMENILEDRMFTADGNRQYRVGFSYLDNGLQNDETRYDNSDKAAFHAQFKYEFYK